MSRPLFVLTAILFAACVVPVEAEEGDEVASEPITRLTVAGGAGDLRVTGDPTVTEARLRWRMTWSDERPTLHLPVEGGAWDIDVDCAEQLVCRVDLDVTVPEAVVADLAIGSGDITARTLTGAVGVSTGSGDITLDTLAGEVRAELGSGDLTGLALGAGLVADVGSGDTDLAFTVPADVALSTGSGDVRLAVPTGSYAVAIETGSGDVSVSGVEEDPAGAFSLVVETGSGDVTIIGE